MGKKCICPNGDIHVERDVVLRCDGGDVLEDLGGLFLPTKLLGVSVLCRCRGIGWCGWVELEWAEYIFQINIDSAFT